MVQHSLSAYSTSDPNTYVQWSPRNTGGVSKLAVLTFRLPSMQCPRSLPCALASLRSSHTLHRHSTELNRGSHIRYARTRAECSGVDKLTLTDKKHGKISITAFDVGCTYYGSHVVLSTVHAQNTSTNATGKGVKATYVQLSYIVWVWSGCSLCVADTHTCPVASNQTSTFGGRGMIVTLTYFPFKRGRS